MELRDYIRMFIRRGWIAILVAVIAAGVAYGVSKMQTPVVSASTQLSVQPARADWGLSNVLKDLLRNYVANIQTHTTAQKVIDLAELDMSTDDLLSKLFVSSDASTFTIKIEAHDTDPTVAYKIVDTVAKVFIDDRNAWNAQQDKRDRIDVAMLDSVYSLGYKVYSPKTKINTLAGGLFGLMVGVLVIFFLEWLEQGNIRTADDVERLLGVTVLGQIPAHHGESHADAESRQSPKFIPDARKA